MNYPIASTSWKQKSVTAASVVEVVCVMEKLVMAAVATLMTVSSAASSARKITHTSK